MLVSRGGLVRGLPVKAAHEYAARSQRPRDLLVARIMLLILTCLIMSAAAVPVSYDQRQDGEENIRTDIENVVFLIAVPQKMNIPLDMFGLLRTNKGNNQPEIQDRADVQVMEAFVEPNTPYRVEIGTNNRLTEGDGRAVEIVIPGRKYTDPEAEVNPDELKLLGATEQCGPERERDPVTLVCRLRSQPASSSEGDSNKKNVKIDSQPTPEVILS